MLTCARIKPSLSEVTFMNICRIYVEYMICMLTWATGQSLSCILRGSPPLILPQRIKFKLQHALIKQLFRSANSRILTVIMVGLDIVKASNAQVKELGPNLVALFGKALLELWLVDPSFKLWLTTMQCSWRNRRDWSFHSQRIRQEYIISSNLSRRAQPGSRRRRDSRMQRIKSKWEGWVFESRCF